MATTAEGVFKIIDQASDPIKQITKVTEIMDKSVQQAGKALEDLGGAKIKTAIKTTKDGIKGVGEESTKTKDKVKESTKSISTDIEKMSFKGVKDVEKLTTAIKYFGDQRESATLDVDIAKAEAKLRLLKQQLRSVSTADARSELGLMEAEAVKATAALTGGVGGGGGGAGGLAGGFFAAGGRAAFMGAALLVALPAIVAVGGAVSALVGSLALAAGGAGALGVGAMGAFVVGLGAIVAVAKPAMNTLKEVKKAQDDYNKSVAQYGAESAQAVKAQKALQQQQKKNPGAAGVIQNASVLGSRFTKATGPARADFFGILNAGLTTANNLLPTFGRITNQVFDSLRKGVDDFLKPFRGGEWKSIFTTLGQTFSKISGPALRALGNMALFFGRIARAASPFVVKAFEALERWTGNLAKGVGNQAKTAQTIGKLVDHFKAWVHLGGAAVKLMAAFFGAGATQGKSVVESITDQFDKWTDWLHEHPGEMKDFFDKTIDSAGKLVDAISKIAAALVEIGTAMMPLLNLVSTLTSMLGNNGLITPLAALAGGKFLLGKFGARGAGAAAAGGIGAGEAALGGAAAATGVKGAAGAIRSGLQVAGSRGLPVAARIGGANAAMDAAALGAGTIAKRVPLVAGAWAGYNFLKTQGTLGERTQNAVSSIVPFVPKATTRAENRTAGQDDAAKFLGEGRSTRAISGRVRSLQSQLTEREDSSTVVGGRGHHRVIPSTELKLSGDAREKVQQQLNALKPVLKTQVKVEQQQKALTAFDKLLGSFDILAKGHKGGKIFGYITNELAKLKPEGKRTLLHATAEWAETMSHGSKAQRKIAAQTRGYIIGQYAAMGKSIAIVEGHIYDTSKGQWASIHKAISDPMELAKQETQNAFTAMQKVAAQTLRNMGFSGSTANNLVANMDKSRPQGTRDAASRVAAGGADANGNPVVPTNKAHGGRIGGVGLRDTVPVAPGEMAAPGELIVNRHTEDRVNKKLMRLNTTLDREIGKETRPHHAPLKPQNPMVRKGGAPEGTDAQYGIMPGLAYGGRLQNWAKGKRKGQSSIFNGLGVQGELGQAITRGVNAGMGAAAGAQAGQGRYAAMVAKANEIEGHHYPYVWGGGHNANFTGPYDCSGAVSSVLHAGGVLGSPLVSGALASFGQPGPGQVTIYANPEHTYMSLGGNFFGTSQSNPGGGAGYFPGGARPGFTVRHVPVDGTVGVVGVEGGGGGVPSVNLPRRKRSSAAGVAGMMSNRVSDMIWAGGEKKINKMIGATGGAGGGRFNAKGRGVMGASVFGGPGDPGTGHIGYRGDDLNTKWDSFAELNMGTAMGGLPYGAAVDVKGPKGSLTLYKRDIGAGGGPVSGHPRKIDLWYKAAEKLGIGGLGLVNATGGAAAKKAFGGRIGALPPNQTAGQGRAPQWGGWHQEGTAFTAHRPTLIGVGEGGAEKVKVTKAAAGGTAGAKRGAPKFEVHIGKIVNNEKGDIKKIVERELKAAAKALNHGPLDDEDELGL